MLCPKQKTPGQRNALGFIILPTGINFIIILVGKKHLLREIECSELVLNESI